jgi:Uma2 family endonuclease
MSAPAVHPHMTEEFLPPEALPRVDHLVTEDDAPVESLYAERQMPLLVEPLYTSWRGPGPERAFVAMSNVGMFFSQEDAPFVPDVLLSLDVRLPPHLREKRYRSYFFWEFGKAPDVCIEIVSNREGEELGRKLRMYAQLGIAYYVVWDAMGFLGAEPMHAFVLKGRSYAPLTPVWFPEIGLGLQPWQGRFLDAEESWLRWVDDKGELLLTGSERAEQERQRADRLAAQLRALGVEPSA